MVTIKKISWLSREALEAEVIISDGNFDIVCFAHPLIMELGDQLTEPLYSLNPSNIIKIYNPNMLSLVEKLSRPFSYFVQGKLKDRESGIVQLGEIEIEIDCNFLPADITNGDSISFSTDRFDL